ncbi:MAG: hypothetical protein ACREUU_09395, partial [Gammaproteobacteria bacterium]
TGRRKNAMPDKDGPPALPVIRRILLALLLLGLLGTGTELLLLDHFAGPWQLIPLVLIALGIVVFTWHVVQRGRATVRALQATMVLFVMGGLTGFVLHYRGNMEFQLEIDPSIGGLDLFLRVMRAKAPPALAPGSMIHLGLLGLAYAYRHPALAGPRSDTTNRSLT